MSHRTPCMSGEGPRESAVPLARQRRQGRSGPLRGEALTSEGGREDVEERQGRTRPGGPIRDTPPDHRIEVETGPSFRDVVTGVSSPGSSTRVLPGTFRDSPVWVRRRRHLLVQITSDTPIACSKVRAGGGVGRESTLVSVHGSLGTETCSPRTGERGRYMCCRVGRPAPVFDPRGHGSVLGDVRWSTRRPRSPGDTTVAQRVLGPGSGSTRGRFGVRTHDPTSEV